MTIRLCGDRSARSDQRGRTNGLNDHIATAPMSGRADLCYLRDMAATALRRTETGDEDA